MFSLINNCIEMFAYRVLDLNRVKPLISDTKLVISFTFTYLELGAVVKACTIEQNVCSAGKWMQAPRISFCMK